MAATSPIDGGIADDLALSPDGSRLFVNYLAVGEILVMDVQQMIEAVYLGLRQTRGLAVADFNQKFAVDFKGIFKPVIDDPGLSSLLEYGDDCFRLTPEGMLVMDTVVGRFVDLIPF